VSPTSSKKRSNTMCLPLGSTPSAAREAAPPGRAQLLRGRGRQPQVLAQPAFAGFTPPSASSVSAVSQTRDTASLSSSVRPRLSPSQNGIEGGCPLASSTITLPVSTLAMR
jgi:hypothetical protein